MSVSLKQFGGTLREARETQGWSLDELSRRTRISRSYLWKMEQGRANPSLSILETLGEAYEVPPGELVGILRARLLGSQRQAPCPHPPHRMYTWWAEDARGRDLMVACCDCGEVLRGKERG